MSMTRQLLLLCAVPLLAACNGAATPGPSDPSKADKEQRPKVQKLDRVVVTAYTAEELMQELDRARSLLLVDKFEEAAKAFDRLMRLATAPGIKALATFNSGIAYEGLGDRDKAVERYREVAKQYPAEPVAANALVRQTRLLGYLERWDELVAAAGELLARAELPVMMRIEGLGAKALAHVEKGELQQAEIAVGKAATLIDKHGFGRAGTPPVQLAQVSFAEGELRRIESERIKLVVTDAGGNQAPAPNFGAVLEARCAALLRAQSAYTEAMRARDAHWSAMSGYRVGQLYQQLHREAVAIPVPKNATLKQQQLFQAAMRLRYRILLEKGLRMMDGTLRLAERTGLESFWVARARQAKQSLEQSLADEKAALAKLPYTEEEVRLALDKLKEQAKNAASPNP